MNMWTINRILLALFDVVYRALVALHPVVALIVVSGVFGVLALLVVRYCSRQEAIGRIKDRIRADLLSIWLYKDELRVMFRAVPRILWGALRLQGNMLPPLLVMLLPMVLICAQMAAWHEWRPLRVGERALLKVTLDAEAGDADLNLEPRLPAGVTVSHRNRSPKVREVCWYVQAERPGRYQLSFDTGGEQCTKELVVGDAFGRVSPVRHRGGWVDSFLYPTEEPLPDDSVFRSIAVGFPGLDSWLYGSAWWIIWFLVYSIVVALIVKPYLRVNF